MVVGGTARSAVQQWMAHHLQLCPAQKTAELRASICELHSYSCTSEVIKPAARAVEVSARGGGNAYEHTRPLAQLHCESVGVMFERLNT